MSESLIPTMTDIMAKNARDTIEVMFFSEKAAGDFERALMKAEEGGAQAGDLIELVSLAYAAHAVAQVKDEGSDGDMFGLAAVWYRDMGQRLLRRAMDAISTIAADEVAGAGAGLN